MLERDEEIVAQLREGMAKEFKRLFICKRSRSLAGFVSHKSQKELLQP